MTAQFLLKEQNELLKQLVKNTSPKDSQQSIVRSTKTDFDTIYKEPIELSNEKEYEIGLCKRGRVVVPLRLRKSG